jgi:hypothetical protein
VRIGQKFVEPAMGVANSFDQDRTRVGAHRADVHLGIANALDDLALATRRGRRPG